jgi:hypothetical protein
LVAVLAGCGGADEEPVRVARQFTAAVQRGDIEALLPLLDRAIVARLEEAAERASDQVGGRRAVATEEMLQVSVRDPGFGIASATLLENDGNRARVELRGPEDESEILELVFQDGSWRVKLPVASP